MKKYLYTVLLATAPALLIAQTPIVTLTTEEGEVVNETTVYVECLATQSTDTVSLLATLNADAETAVNVRRYEVDVVAQTRNFYCWGVCYNPRLAGNTPVWESVHPVYIPANETVNNFHAYYKPEGNSGTSTFRFVWFNLDDPNDSTWVDIVYNATDVGVGENVGGVLGFDTYPNPAVDANMTVRLSLDASVTNAQLVIYNALGSKVLNRSLRGSTATVVLQHENFQPGVYFASIESGGKALRTRRIIIGR